MDLKHNEIVEKNKRDWNQYSESYMGYNLSDKVLQPILENPARAFHHITWDQIRKFVPDLKGKRICVPSSGDNHAVFAFALMGAQVTSCDISEKQLAAAKAVAAQLGLGEAITFICTDTMTLDGVETESYDFVYTSNGVHVWLNDLPAMYRSIFRVLKPGGVYILYELHPFLRPFGEKLKVKKPYSETGPIEDELTVNFHWRMQDILNAILDSQIQLVHMEEIMPEIDYERPFWIKNEDIIKGASFTREEVEKMYSLEENPAMALPEMFCLVGRKPRI